MACKSIAKNRLVTQEDVRSVKLEIEIMTRLSGHPNVVDLKAVYEEEDCVHLVMELCAGENFSTSSRGMVDFLRLKPGFSSMT